MLKAHKHAYLVQEVNYFYRPYSSSMSYFMNMFSAKLHKPTKKPLLLLLSSILTNLSSSSLGALIIGALRHIQGALIIVALRHLQGALIIVALGHLQGAHIIVALGHLQGDHIIGALGYCTCDAIISFAKT